MSNKTHEDVPVMYMPKQLYGRNMLEFKKIIEKKYNKKIDDIWDLHKWSVDNIPELWSELWDFSGIIYSKPFEKVIDVNIALEESPLWFKGAKLNYAENLLKYRDDKIAFIYTDEKGKESEKLTYAQLYEESKLYAAAFRKFGLRKGDVVVCQMPNRKETLISMIAVISIGAIWTTVLALIGSEATLNRVKQVEPKIYLTIDSILRNGDYINMLPKIKEISEGLPSLRKVIIVASNEESRSDISDIKNSCFLNEFLLLGVEEHGLVPPLLFEQVSFNHPVFILFTSGTSGIPKAVVHGSGVLLSLFRDYALHLDLHEGSVCFTQLPVGWVAFNYFSCMLFCGVTLVFLEDGASLCHSTLWNLIDHYGVNLSIIPTHILDGMRKAEYIPTKENLLKSLKVIITGGSIVTPQNYDFIYEKVKKDITFTSMYGCTELIGSAFFSDVSLPIYRGECPALCLGLKLEILDEYGNPVFGEMGEIVIASPIPNMLLGLWNDKDNLKFRETYFSKYTGKFAMNDCGIINPFTKGVTLCGRSDEVLKCGVHRFASSEIYNVVEKFPEIIDSVCVSQRSQNKVERAVLFIKMRDGYSFNDELVRRIRDAAKREMFLLNGPDIILETKDIPYNVNGKKLEMVVKNIINNRPYTTETALNPESLKNFYNIPELQGY